MNRIILICLLVAVTLNKAIHREYDHMKNLTADEIRSKFLGLEITEMNLPKMSHLNDLALNEVPESFDSRE